MTDNDSKSRRSMPKRAAKRKADELEDENLSSRKSKPELVDTAAPGDNFPLQQELSYRWIDAGDPAQGGVTDHKLLEMVVDGVTSIIAVGDCILLRSSEYDDNHGMFSSPSKEVLAQEVAFVARVERMWEDSGRKKVPREDRMKIRARWFFKKEDVQSLGGGMIGPISRLQLIGTMADRDLILSDQADDNDVLTILGKCTVLMRRPSEDDPIPDLPLGTFVSRYSISFGETPRSAVLTPFVGENDPWPLDETVDDEVDVREHRSWDAILRVDEKEATIFLDKGGNKMENVLTIARQRRNGGGNPFLTGNADNTSLDGKKRKSSNETAFGSDNDTVSDEMTSSSSGSDRQFDGEGSTKGRILVGPDHQASVLPFKGKQEIASRNPIRVWDPNRMDQTDLNAYLARAADILTPYLNQNCFVMEDPYLPLPTEKVDVFLEGQSSVEFLTLSDVSTASSMSEKRNKLTRECSIDDLFAALHNNDYKSVEALTAVASSPRDYVTVWSRKEKDLFDKGFRRFSGSLRMISKGIAISKSFKDVVDYHYRFKIPDQFRRYQNKKREHAVRMMNIVEGRRNIEVPIQSRSDEMVTPARVQREKKMNDRKRAQDWAKTAMPEVIGAVQDRRVAAKELLLQIQLELGTEKMTQIAEAIKLLHLGSVSELKERVVDLLHERPELLDKFLEYLPKRFRF